jgi:hypothetical protein
MDDQRAHQPNTDRGGDPPRELLTGEANDQST